MKRLVIFLIALIVITVVVFKYFDIDFDFYFLLFIESYIDPLQNQKQIEISPNYKDRVNVDLYVAGLSRPTSMSFVDNNTILVSEKDQGNVRIISNGTLQEDPIYTVNNISHEKEQGLLGITSSSKYESKKETPTDYLNFNSTSYPVSSMDAFSSFHEPRSHNSNHVIYLYF